MNLLRDVLSTFKSKSLVFIILVVLVILYVLSIYLTMFEKEITIGQKYVRPAGRYSHYQIVDESISGSTPLCITVICNEKNKINTSYGVI